MQGFEPKHAIRSHRVLLALGAASCGGGSGPSGPPPPPAPPPVASIQVTSPADSAVVGGTLQLTAVARDAAGNPLNGRPILWTSSDTTRARVSTTGLVTATRPGSVTVTAEAEGRTGSVELRLQYDARYLDSRVFDGWYYRELHATVPAIASGTTADLARHWLVSGIDEGRQAHRNFAVREYLALHAEVRARTDGSTVAAIDDYLTNGVSDGLPGIAVATTPATAVLAQPALREQPIGAVFIGFWNMGRDAIASRPGGDLSPWTGLALPAPRNTAQWAVGSWPAGPMDGRGPVAAQIYNGWVGISTDSRSGRTAWAAQGASPDTPIDINLTYHFPSGPGGIPKPFGDGSTGLVWEADLQVPTLGSTGQAAAYLIQYFFLRDDVSQAFVAYGTVLLDSRGASFPQQLIAYDACSACTRFLIVQTKLGSGAPWHSIAPGSTIYAGHPYREIRRVALTISPTQFVEGIRAAKQRYPELAGLSEVPSTWRVATWVLDVEVGALTQGEAWIGASVRPIRAGVVP